MTNSTIPDARSISLDDWLNQLWLDKETTDDLMHQIDWLPKPHMPRAMMAKRALKYLTRAALRVKKQNRHLCFARAMRFEFPRRRLKGGLSASSVLRFLASTHYQNRVYKDHLTFEYNWAAYTMDIEILKMFMDAVCELHAKANS